MPGVKISELNSTTQLNDTDYIPLARPGLGNGSTFKIPGSVFGKQADVTSLTNNKVSKAGDTMTGKLTLDGDPTQNLHAATKSYVDTLNSTALGVANNKVSKSGDTMTGKLTLDGDPTAPLHAATKQYVDGQISGAVGALGKTWADFKCS